MIADAEIHVTRYRQIRDDPTSTPSEILAAMGRLEDRALGRPPQPTEALSPEDDARIRAQAAAEAMTPDEHRALFMELREAAGER